MTKNKHLKKRDSQGKNLSSRPSIDYDEAKPLFSLEYVGVKKYDLKSCTDQDKGIFLEAIYKRSGLMWKQIKSLPYKNGLGCETLTNEEINKKLRERAKKELTDDVKIRIFCVKPRTKMRMVGHRDGQVFYILFLDPRGDLYTH